jgi:hypothetical protein
MKKGFALLVCSMLAAVAPVSAQIGSLTSDSPYFNELRTISTAVPIISISPDSRSGAMGDVGVATSPDAASLFWNPAKLAFLDDGARTLSLSYTPWLNKLVNDINLAYVSYVFKMGDNQGMGFALRYFSLGTINFRDENNVSLGDKKPYEFALNGAYALKLNDNMGLAVGLRYIFSDLTQGVAVNGAETNPGQSFAADLGYYYKSREYNMEGGMKQSASFGLNISNVGGKISYGNDADADFIPTNLRVGGGYHLRFDEYNRMSFYVDLNKLLVPTPPIREGDTGYEGDPNGNNDPNDREVLFGQDDNVSSFAGIFQSFSDAPGGGSEELEEVVVNVGAEFWYDDRFALRGGYQYEDEQKGGRQYFTLGLGVKFNVFGLDFAYLIPASATVRSPLENTLRFSLLFDFENFSSQDK